MRRILVGSKRFALRWSVVGGRWSVEAGGTRVQGDWLLGMI